MPKKLCLLFTNIIFVTVGMFNGTANGSNHHQSSNSSSSANTGANSTGGESFQIKPVKQRTKKKHTTCTLL